jgi:hypothetical protein
LSFSGAIRITFLNALPSQSTAARDDKCHKLAKNSSFFTYSLISASPGLKDGIIVQGTWDSDVGVVPPEPCTGPPSSDDILDQKGFQ